MYLDILESFLTRCVNALVVPRQGRAGGCEDLTPSLSGNVGGVLDLDGRSQDTPFFSTHDAKNQLDETHSARPPQPQSVAVVRGERTGGKNERCNAPKYQDT